MGISNFAGKPDDKDTGGSGGSGNLGGALGALLGGGGISMPPPGDMDDPKTMLINYNERFKAATPTLFRDGLITQTLSVLIGKEKPNPLLVGAAGVGKTRIVEDIARRIEIKDPSIPAQLHGYTVYELPLSNIIAGAGVVGQLEERLIKLIAFATDPGEKAILFIDEIHQIQDTHNPIYQKVSQILKPALSRGEMRLIGATTLAESRTFDNDPAFARRFSRLIVEELDQAQTIEILRSARPGYLAHYNYKVSVTDDMLHTVAVVADETSRADSHRPDSALTLLDRSFADAVVKHAQAVANATAAGDTGLLNALKTITVLPLNENRLRTVALALATGMAVKPSFNKAETVAALARLQGQGHIISQLVNALERDALAVFPRVRPTAWMLAGPSGTGKTETAKIVAQQLTGQPPIILSMNQFSHAHDQSKLTGSGPGYLGSESNKELPLSSLESNPYRVVLLDELEKAHPAIHAMLLGALDEGWMRMADGKILDLSKVLFIATTNAGSSQLGKTGLGFVGDIKQDGLITEQRLNQVLSESFTPEFLGRFTKKVSYAPISEEIYAQILLACYTSERDRIIAATPRHTAALPAVLDPDVLAASVKSSRVVSSGARPAMIEARRLIEDALLAYHANTGAQQLSVAPAQPTPAVISASHPHSGDADPATPDDDQG